MVPLLPLRDGVRALPISSFRQSMPSFYMNAPDCICSPGRLPLGAFCTGRDDLEREALHDDRISIRAPRAGCDFDGLKKLLNGTSFQSTRPVWGATRLRQVRGKARQFQSTRPVRGATTSGGICVCRGRYFNPRAPCGARLVLPSHPRKRQPISIHAPRVGRDEALLGCCRETAAFQSTHPVRGATNRWRKI